MLVVSGRGRPAVWGSLVLSRLLNRAAAASGALFVLLILVGNAVATGDGSNSHPSGPQVLADLAKDAHSASATFGFVMEVTGFGSLLVFLGFLSSLQQRRTVAGGTALAAGISMLAIKLGSAAPMIALAQDRSTMTPGMAQVLNDINGAAFAVSWLPFAVLVIAAALMLNEAALVGRPTKAAGIVIGIVGFVAAFVAMKNPADGNPVAFLLGLVWVLVVSARLAVRRGSEPAIVDATVRVPVAV